MLRKLSIKHISDRDLILASVVFIGTISVQKAYSIYKNARKQGWRRYIISKVSGFLRKFGSIKEKIATENQKSRESFRKTFDDMTYEPILTLPDQPLPNILELITARAESDSTHRVNNRLSGALYHGGNHLSEIATQAMRLYIFANPLHPDIFPSIRQMECEIVQMTLNLFNAKEENCGVLTSGGTESLLLSALAYRQWGRSKGITEPEIIMSESVHAAVSKAAHYFGITLKKVKIDHGTGAVSIRDIERQINGNTVAIYASAPGFPHGIFDPVEELGQLALKYRINLHVDACLGGFLTPFVELAGYKVPICDFRAKGVTSISCDLHKFGYTPKGISVLMYASQELRRFQYFSCSDWPGGLYLTTNTSGSRPGVLSAGAWAVMMSIGKQGYIDCAKEIMEATNYIKENSKFPDLEIIGTPVLNIVAFTSKTLNPHAIGAALKSIGKWSLNHLQNPDAFHLCVTYANAGEASQFVSDLKKAVDLIRDNPKMNSDVVALYGMVAQIPDKSIVEEISLNYGDFLFSFK